MAEHKTIRRPREGRLIGGVCKGISDYSGMDVSIIRILWAVTVFFWLPGALLYLIAWLIIPAQPC